MMSDCFIVFTSLVTVISIVIALILILHMTLLQIKNKKLEQKSEEQKIQIQRLKKQPSLDLKIDRLDTKVCEQQQIQHALVDALKRSDAAWKKIINELDEIKELVNKESKNNQDIGW